MSARVPRAGAHRGDPGTLVADTPRSWAKAQRKHRWSRAWAARFIAKWEGFSPDAVLDSIAQPPIWTIGYGHTGGVAAGERWSRRHALRVLNQDVRWAAAAVAEKVGHRLTVRQRIALISFVFNLGPGVLEGELLHKINSGDMAEAARLMKHYNHAGGVVVEGLTRRRDAEAWMMTHSKRRKK